MSSPSKENEKPSSSGAGMQHDTVDTGSEIASAEAPRPPAKRPLSTAVIEISDTDSDDSDVCAVNSYQASVDEVKRIRGEYSSSSSSSSDYSSDSESPWEDDSIVIVDNKVGIKPIKAQLNPRANRMDDPKINPVFKVQESKESLALNWKELKDFTTGDITLTCEPFRICLLKNFLANPEIINNMIDDMNTLDWERKKMDLYEFHQTADLASLTWQRSIRGIYELLKTEFMSWVSEVTGMELNSVSASCSLYGPGDHLLVHDDLMGDRRVAFILYLAPWNVPSSPTITVENGSGDYHKQEADIASGDEHSDGWAAHMGGALELLSCDDEGPSKVCRRVLPRNNMLAFFRVHTDSFHQVEEVVSLELPRLSINGWFHGPPPPSAPPPTIPQYIAPHNNPVLVNEWVEATYMSPRCRAQIQTQMERSSEACLHSFLQRHQYRRLLHALQAPETEWEWAGGRQRRWYEVVGGAWAERLGAGHAVRDALQLLASAAFLRLLHACTALPLQRLQPPQLRRHTPATYTLLPPREEYQHPRLEVCMYLGTGVGEGGAVGGAGRGGRGAGGGVVYVAPEDAAGGALLSLAPHDNALNLVYCDAGSASFTRYLSRLTAPHHPPFYLLTCTYSE